MGSNNAGHWRILFLKDKLHRRVTVARTHASGTFVSEDKPAKMTLYSQSTYNQMYWPREWLTLEMQATAQENNLGRRLS